MSADGEDTVPRLQQRITDRTGRGGGRSGRGGRGGGRRNSIAFSAPSPSSGGAKPAVYMPTPREANRRRMTMGAKAIPEAVEENNTNGDADAFDRGELSRLATRKAALDNELNACMETSDPSDPGLQAKAARVWAELEEVGANTVKVQAEAVSRRASLTATAAQRRASMPMAAMAEVISPSTGSSGISNGDSDGGNVEMDADALLSLHEEAEKASQVAAQAAAEAAAQAQIAQAAEARAVEARAAELALAHKKAMSAATTKEAAGGAVGPVEASTTVAIGNAAGSVIASAIAPPAAPAPAATAAGEAAEAAAKANADAVAAAQEAKASLAAAQAQALAAAQAKEKLEAELAAASKWSAALEEKLASTTAQLQAATQSEAKAVAAGAAAKTAAEEAERAVEAATARADAAEAKASSGGEISSASSSSSGTTAIATVDNSNKKNRTDDTNNDGSSGIEDKGGANGSSHDLSMLVRVGRGLHAAASSEAMVVGVEHLVLLRTVPSCRALSTAQLQVLLKTCSLVDFERGEVLIASGTKSPGAFVVLSGRVVVTYTDTASSTSGGGGGGGRKESSTLSTGSVVGERSLMASEPSRFRAVASHPLAGGRTRCLLVPRRGLQDAWADVAYLSGGAHALTAGARHAAAEPTVGSLAAYAQTLTSLHQDLNHQGKKAKKSGSSGSGGGNNPAAENSKEEDDDGDDDVEVDDVEESKGGRVRVRDLATGFNAARTEDPLSTAERTAVSLLLFESFSPELNLDDSLSLLLATAQRLLNVEQIRLFWPVNAPAQVLTLRAVGSALRSEPMRWAGAAAATAAAAGAAAATASGESADPAQLQKEEEEREKREALPLEWDANDPLQCNDVATLNARTDRRCGVLTRGCLAVPLLQHSSESDHDDDAGSSASASTSVNGAAAAFSGGMGVVSSECVGVLELVNSMRPRQSFTAKDKALASLLAQEVTALMSLRADEVAFLSGAPFTDSLDNNGDETAGRGRRFSSYGSNNYGYSPSSSSSSSSSSFSSKDQAAASGFVALSQVVDVPLDQALGPQLDLVRRSSGAVSGGCGGHLSLMAGAGGAGAGGARGKRGSVVGGTGSSGFVLLTVTQVNLDLRPSVALALLDEAHEASSSDDAAAAAAAAGVLAPAKTLALRNWLLGRNPGSLLGSTGLRWCVVRVTLVHGDAPLAPPWVSSRVPLKLHDLFDDTSGGLGDDYDHDGSSSGSSSSSSKFNALSATAVLEGPGSMAGGAGGVGTGGRVKWGSLKSRDLPRASRVLIEVLAVAPPPKRERKVAEAPTGLASSSLSKSMGSGKSSWWSRSSSSSSSVSRLRSSTTVHEGERVPVGGLGDDDESGEGSGSSKGWPAVELKARFEVAAAWAAMQREEEGRWDESLGGDGATTQLDRESFKKLVGSLLTEQGASLGGYFLATGADLEAAFELVATGGSGKKKKGMQFLGSSSAADGGDGDDSGTIDCFSFIKLFHAIEAGQVKGLGLKEKSSSKNKAMKARRMSIQAAVRGTGHPFVCGELVCWRGADADIPAGSVGEVLCIHDDGDVEVLFFAGTAYEAVYTFGADRLERADVSSTSDPNNSASSSSNKSKSKSSAKNLDNESAAAAAAATTAKRAAQHAQAVAQGVLLGWSVVPLFGPDHALKFPGQSEVGLVLSDTALLEGGSGGSGSHKYSAGVPRYRYTKEGRTEIKPSKESAAAAAAAASSGAATSAGEEAGEEEGPDGTTSNDSATEAAAVAATDTDSSKGSSRSGSSSDNSAPAPVSFSHSALIGSSALRRPMTVGVSALGPGGGVALSTTLVFGVTADARQVVYSDYDQRLAVPTMEDARAAVVAASQAEAKAAAAQQHIARRAAADEEEANAVAADAAAEAKAAADDDAKLKALMVRKNSLAAVLTACVEAANPDDDEVQARAAQAWAQTERVESEIAAVVEAGAERRSEARERAEARREAAAAAEQEAAAAAAEEEKATAAGKGGQGDGGNDNTSKIGALFNNSGAGDGNNAAMPLPASSSASSKLSTTAALSTAPSETDSAPIEALDDFSEVSPTGPLSVRDVLNDGLEQWEVKLGVVPAQVQHLIQRHGLFTKLTLKEKTLLWRHRKHLVNEEKSHVALLAAATDWSSRAQVLEVYRLFRTSSPPDPLAALFLLGPQFPDPKLRALAVRALDALSDAALSQLMLQLVQVLKFEPSHDTALGRLLLQRALLHPPSVGHALYWTLKSEKDVVDPMRHCAVLLELYLRHATLKARRGLGAQVYVVNVLKALTEKVIGVAGEQRRTAVLREELARIQWPGCFALPLSGFMRCSGVIPSKCKVMSSKKRPFWLTFKNHVPRGRPHIVLFKTGDDLRQDQLTLQVLRVMDGLWVHAGLHLQLPTYACVATGQGEGFLEAVPNAHTLAGVTAQGLALAQAHVTASKREAKDKNAQRRNFELAASSPNMRSSTGSSSSSRRSSSAAATVTSAAIAAATKAGVMPKQSAGKYAAAMEAYFGVGALDAWLTNKAEAWAAMTEQERTSRRATSVVDAFASSAAVVGESLGTEALQAQHRLLAAGAADAAGGGGGGGYSEALPLGGKGYQASGGRGRGGGGSGKGTGRRRGSMGASMGAMSGSSGGGGGNDQNDAAEAAELGKLLVRPTSLLSSQEQSRLKYLIDQQAAKLNSTPGSSSAAANGSTGGMPTSGGGGGKGRRRGSMNVGGGGGRGGDRGMMGRGGGNAMVAMHGTEAGGRGAMHRGANRMAPRMSSAAAAAMAEGLAGNLGGGGPLGASARHRLGLGMGAEAVGDEDMREESDQLAEARDHFRSSCAACCVSTFILGLGDRHNDNIMLTEDGRLFHIDFGHFLGNFKAKFGVKREAAPFIFTPHMAAVMGGAQPAGARYLQFQELCVRAFLVLRRYSNLLLALFSLLVDCGIPELQTISDLAWMDDALMSEMTEADAAAAFLGLLTEALNCRTTRVNHALHILAKH